MVFITCIIFCSVDFRPIAQIYVMLLNNQLMWDSLKDIFRRNEGSEYTLVGSDGVELEDCPETEVHFPHRACILESS